MTLLPVKRALLSVTDKRGLNEFAAFLDQGGVQLISTGGTRQALLDAGIAVTSVSDVTGFPEILDGRVKTLHPHVHGPLLADKRNPEHMRILEGLGLQPLDLICVNLYDFAKAQALGLNLKDCVEQIDIGGPTLIRAAAKNFHSVLVVPDPALYPRIISEMQTQDYHVGLPLRRETAARAFALTSRYDAMIAAYLERSGLQDAPDPSTP